MGASPFAVDEPLLAAVVVAGESGLAGGGGAAGAVVVGDGRGQLRPPSQRGDGALLENQCRRRFRAVNIRRKTEKLARYPCSHSERKRHRHRGAVARLCGGTSGYVRAFLPE